MFDIRCPDAARPAPGGGPRRLPEPGPAGPVPLERLEAQICELAGHLAAATCRFLVLLGDFDARQGWAAWDMPSCAAWLSWKCQLSPGTAREQVRVARALRDLPVIRAEFAAGRMSYAKVRALTRIAAPDTEADLAVLAGPMTASQLERFARAHRTVTAADDAAARVRRRLAWRFDEDGSLSVTVHLPPLQGAVLIQALRAAAGDLDHSRDRAPAEDRPPGASSEGHGRVSAETRPAGPPDADTAGTRRTSPGDAGRASRGTGLTSSSLADALIIMAESYLAGQIATAASPDIYQVVVHTSADALARPPAPAPAAGQPGGKTAGSAAGGPQHRQTATRVSAETRARPARPGQAAGPGRCHVDDGPAISVTTAQMIACQATLSWMTHGRDGTVLDLGRKQRRPSAALRRAARERDKGRCRFPGCQSRRVDLHHIQYWSNGGRTCLTNLISFCPRHHRLVHERGYLITPAPGGAFTVTRPDGTPLPTSPPLPEPRDGDITGCHEADITPETIVPAWYGERLDLDYAIATCFASIPYQPTGERQPA